MSEDAPEIKALAKEIAHLISAAKADAVATAVSITKMRAFLLSDGQNDALADIQEELDCLGHRATVMMTSEEQVFFRLDAAVSAVKKVLSQLQYELTSKSNANVHPINDPNIRSKVWALTSGKCAYCGCDLSQGDHDSRGTSFSVEHVVPRQHGGPDNLANYVPSCASCNSSKSTSHVLEFINMHIERRINRRAELRVVNSDVVGE